MLRFDEIAHPADLDFLVAFSDLTNFSRVSSALAAGEVFRLMDGYAEFAGGIVEGAGGRVVKVMGDALMIAFPAEEADAGVAGLMKLKEEGDAWMAERGHPCRHRIKAHVGPVHAGPMGPVSAKRFDLYGPTVNIAATVASRGFAMTPPVFRKLGPETRKRFKKHTPPVVYIPVEESHGR